MSLKRILPNFMPFHHIKEHEELTSIYNKMGKNEESWVKEFNSLLEKNFDIKKNDKVLCPLKSLNITGSDLYQMEKFWIVLLKKRQRMKEQIELIEVIDFFKEAFSKVDEERQSQLKFIYLKTIKGFTLNELTQYAKSNNINTDIKISKDEVIEKTNENENITSYTPIPNSLCFSLIGFKPNSSKILEKKKYLASNESSITFPSNPKIESKLKTPVMNITNPFNRNPKNIKNEDLHSESEKKKHMTFYPSTQFVSQGTIDRQDDYIHKIEKAAMESQLLDNSQPYQRDPTESLTQTIDHLITQAKNNSP